MGTTATGDNPRAGAPSNTTGLIAELLRQGAERTAVGILHDRSPPPRRTKPARAKHWQP